MSHNALLDENPRAVVATGKGQGGSEGISNVPVRAIVVLVAGMVAAWVATGSIGFLAHPLRHALTWVALAVAIVAGWPRRDVSLHRWLSLAAAVVLGFALTASSLPVVNILAVAVVLAALVRYEGSLRGRIVLLATLAVVVFAVYRLAYTAIPWVWLAANGFGAMLGSLGGWFVAQPLNVGATFGGVDFLVLTVAFYVGWLVWAAPPRLARAVWAAAAIFVAHLLYLIVLAQTHSLLAWLPEVVRPEISDMSHVGVWSWSNMVRGWLPWSLPAVAVVLYAAVVVAMVRWVSWPAPVPPTDDEQEDNEKEVAGRALALESLWVFGPSVLALLLALVTSLALSSSSLQHKTVLAFGQGYLDWSKPSYGAAETGSYGMLPMLVKSLGGQFAVSQELTERELETTDVVLLIHPNRPWPEDRLQRLWRYVGNGGALLLAAEPYRVQGDRASSFNTVLAPTSIAVRRDTAIALTPYWQQTSEPLSHPATIGIDDDRNRFGLIHAASLDVSWPARPLLTGRFGYSDPGSDALTNAGSTYDPGERLGDLVLAAEQSVGRGRVVVLGDASCLHNDFCPNAFVFTGRLLGYLANRGGCPQTWWRQLLGLLFATVLIALLAWRPTAARLAIAAAVLAGCLMVSQATTHWCARVLPDGRDGAPNNNASPNKVAYIDATHLERYSSSPWAPEGVAGLARTLARNGYLPLILPEFTAERVERAGLVVSIAPARDFSAAEHEAVRRLLRKGGTLLCMAGAEHARATAGLLADYQLRIPPSPLPPEQIETETEPLGAFRQIYVNHAGDDTFVQFHAGWPVACDAENPTPIVVWSDGHRDIPVVMGQGVDGGTVAVVGDTFFAANSNLESAGAIVEPNVVFWRWFLSVVADRPPWRPPAVKAEEKTKTKNKSDEKGKPEAGGGTQKAPQQAPANPQAAGEAETENTESNTEVTP